VRPPILLEKRTLGTPPIFRVVVDSVRYIPLNPCASPSKQVRDFTFDTCILFTTEKRRGGGREAREMAREGREGEGESSVQQRGLAHRGLGHFSKSAAARVLAVSVLFCCYVVCFLVGSNIFCEPRRFRQGDSKHRARNSTGPPAQIRPDLRLLHDPFCIWRVQSSALGPLCPTREVAL